MKTFAFNFFYMKNALFWGKDGFLEHVLPWFCRIKNISQKAELKNRSGNATILPEKLGLDALRMHFWVQKGVLRQKCCKKTLGKDMVKGMHEQQYLWRLTSRGKRKGELLERTSPWQKPFRWQRWKNTPFRIQAQNMGGSIRRKGLWIYTRTCMTHTSYIAY